MAQVITELSIRKTKARCLVEQSPVRKMKREQTKLSEDVTERGASQSRNRCGISLWSSTAGQATAFTEESV